MAFGTSLKTSHHLINHTHQVTKLNINVRLVPEQMVVTMSYNNLLSGGIC